MKIHKKIEKLNMNINAMIEYILLFYVIKFYFI